MPALFTEKPSALSSCPWIAAPAWDCPPQHCLLKPRQDSGHSLDVCCNKSLSCFQRRPQSSGRNCQAFLKIPATVQRIAQCTRQHYFREWRIKTQHHFHITNKPTGHTPGFLHWFLNLAPNSVSAPKHLLNFCSCHCAGCGPTASAPSALSPGPLPCTWCLFSHFQLNWRAMPWAGCWGAFGHPGNARCIWKPHYQLTHFWFFSYSGFHRAQQGPSQVQLQVLPVFRETFHYRWLKVHVLFGLFHQSSVCYVGNTALSSIKQTFVASLPSDFWSLGHFGLAINKAQYQLSTIASLITGFKALI